MTAEVGEKRKHGAGGRKDGQGEQELAEERGAAALEEGGRQGCPVGKALSAKPDSPHLVPRTHHGRRCQCLQLSSDPEIHCGMCSLP